MVPWLTRSPAVVVLVAALVGGLVGHGHAQAASSVTIDASRPLGPIGNLYSVGYDGWGDIMNAGMVAAFQELGVRYCRIEVNSAEGKRSLPDLEFPPISFTVLRFSAIQ